MTNITISGKHKNYTPSNFISTSNIKEEVSFDDIHLSVIVFCFPDHNHVPQYIWVEYREKFTVEDFNTIDFKGFKPFGFYTISISNTGQEIAEDIKQNNPHYIGL
ncbi:hypothetical protein GWA97_08110 [Flavobacterium sp. LaA7.5]|nr:hypothetical protein [Flavobacterium salilacus subsp. altitudinum]